MRRSISSRVFAGLVGNLTLTAALIGHAQIMEIRYDQSGNVISSSPGSLSVPALTTDPISLVISADGTTYLTFSSIGHGPLTFQWLSNGVVIAGATGDVLALPGLPPHGLSNGGFELPALVPSFMQFTNGQMLDGWTVESGTVDLVRSGWTPLEGTQSLDLNGTSPGAIYQDVPTVPGRSYFLHFGMAGSPVGAPAIKTNEVWWDGTLLDTVAFNTTGRSVANMGWTNREYIVTATAPTTRLRFASLAGGSYGPALDAVSLFPVAQAVDYSVIVSNAYGSVTSEVARVDYDTDQNSLPDTWERTYFGTIGQLPTSDYDGDGVPNRDEYLEKTDPSSAQSLRPRLYLSAKGGGTVAATPHRASYALNEMVQLSATPDPELVFLQWTGSIRDTNSVVAVELDGTKTIQAVFGKILTNGVNQDGITELDEQDIWGFMANAEENVLLRCAQESGVINYYPRLRLYGPEGVLLATMSDNIDAFISYRTTNSGRFTVTVDSHFPGYTGTYRLRLLQIPGPFLVPADDEGGSLTNGANHDGNNPLGDEDAWTFTANARESVLLRCAQLSGMADYYPRLRLYGPDGVLLTTMTDNTDAFISYRTTNSGTFTVTVDSHFPGYSGTYRLRLLQIPGAFLVPADDEGGSLSNGANHDGNNPLGDEDAWTFTANARESVLLRCAQLSGMVDYYPRLRLYGPDGVLLATISDNTDAFLSYRTTNSGTFTVTVDSLFAGYIGEFRLRFLKIPGEFVIPPGDEGGFLAGGKVYPGITDLGDQDIWLVTGFSGVRMTFTCLEMSGSPSFYPWIRLYALDGTLVTSGTHASSATLTYTPPTSGIFALVVGSFFNGESGSYNLSGEGISGGLTLQPTYAGGSNFDFAIAGGVSNLPFIIFSATNLHQSPVLWTPIWTNRFDATGTFVFTNHYNLEAIEQYFRFSVP